MSERIDRDRHYHTQLEQQLANTTIYCQQQAEIVEKLDQQISDKRAALLELGSQLSEINLHLNLSDLDLSKKQSKSEYLAAQLITKTSEIAASDRSLQVINADIAARQVELTNLESQVHTHIDESDDRELVSLRFQLNSIESEYRDRQSKLVDLESQLLAKTSEIESSARSLQITQAEIINSQVALANLEAQLQVKIEQASQIDIVALKSQLNSIESQSLEKQAHLEYLESQILTKNTEFESKDRDLQLAQSKLITRQAELANLEFHLQSKIEAASQIDIVALKSQLNSIELQYLEKQAHLEYLESQLLTKNTEFESKERDLQLAQSELITRQAELANLEFHLQFLIEEASQIDIVALRSQLNSIELQSREKQARLENLESQLVTKINEIATINRSLELNQLELTDRRSELAELEAKIYAKLEEMDDVELDLKIAMQRIEPQPPQTSRSIDALLKYGEWHQNFIDNPHLEILQHIEKHGAIAEAEVNHKLGNPRSVRQFANKLEEYTQYLPFTIRVESSPQGNRYLRDSQN